MKFGKFVVKKYSFEDWISSICHSKFKWIRFIFLFITGDFWEHTTIRIYVVRTVQYDISHTNHRNLRVYYLIHVAFWVFNVFVKNIIVIAVIMKSFDHCRIREMILILTSLIILNHGEFPSWMVGMYRSWRGWFLQLFEHSIRLKGSPISIGNTWSWIR